MITYYFRCDFDSTYKTFVRNTGCSFIMAFHSFQNALAAVRRAKIREDRNSAS